MADRIEAIRKLLAKNPSDVFLHFSLGMELVSAGKHAEALVAFDDCIRLDARYLPARVEAGKALRAAGRIADARAMFTAAAALAAELGENHTRDYILQQLEGLAG